MPAPFIDKDGGRLPTAAALPTASQMLADYNALSAPNKATFLALIAPVHFELSQAEDALTHTGALPGDTASITGETELLWRLTGTDPTDPGSWEELFQDAPIEEGAEPRTWIDGDGGHLPGDASGGSLAAAWAAMGSAQRAAFRAAIQPTFTVAADQAARLALPNQRRGDYVLQTDSGTLYRLNFDPSTSNDNWAFVYVTG
ncbi:MAG: hypothetical protein V4726_07355 [Verrucomicrobiota bacterium]